MVVPFYWYSGTPNFPYNLEKARKHYQKYGDRIKELFDKDDLETRSQLKVIERMRSEGKDVLYDFEDYLGTGMKKEYFCDEYLSPKGEVTFFDVGAYRGETIEPIRIFYGQRLSQVYAFEPDDDNMNALVSYISSNMEIKEKVKTFDYALSDKEEILHFTSNKGASAITETGGKSVQSVPLDDILDECTIIGDPMLKMDIEGAEMDALKGAHRFIQSYEPYLAICLYHKVEDLFDIPSYLRELVPSYKFYFRGGYHLECWAVPERHFRK